MPHRLILKVTKFQLPTPKRFSTVVKNIFFWEGGRHHAPPMSSRVNDLMIGTNFNQQSGWTNNQAEFPVHNIWNESLKSISKKKLTKMNNINN